MSEPKWTPAQRAAIEDRGGALLVSAAAGSGKTAVLTERAVRLITDPDHPVDADRPFVIIHRADGCIVVFAQNVVHGLNPPEICFGTACNA